MIWEGYDVDNWKVYFANTLIFIFLECQIFKMFPNLSFKFKAEDQAEAVSQNIKTYAGITPEVCKEVCFELESTKCNSFLYDQKKKICQITLKSRRSTDVEFLITNDVDYYERVRCESKLFSWVCTSSNMNLRYWWNKVLLKWTY